MRLADRRVTSQRLLAMLVAVIIGLGPVLTEVRAQEVAPSAGPAVIAAAGEPVLLREQPGWEAVVLTTLGDGSTLDVTGELAIAADGSSWLPVVAAGQSGYVPTGYVASAAPAPETPALDQVPVEPEPLATEAEPPAAEPAIAAAPVGEATTTTDANLRTAPSPDAEIVQVLLPDTVVSVNGVAENGFVPVIVYNTTGWIASELLAQGVASMPAEPAPLVASDAGVMEGAESVELAQRNRDKGKDRDKGEDSGEDGDSGNDSASTGIAWPVSGGEWEVVQGYNNGTHTNRSNFATYKYSLDWALVDGETAGQPIFAPVSGTIEWVDRGSGGMLINTDNGYGVALFHVTFDRDLGSGGSVEQGQRIGRISGPGDDGYMSMAHFEIACWRLNGNGHESVPFVGSNAIAGQEFPDTGGGNQHMGVTVTP